MTKPFRDYHHRHGISPEAEKAMRLNDLLTAQLCSNIASGRDLDFGMAQFMGEKPDG